MMTDTHTPKLDNGRQGKQAAWRRETLDLLKEVEGCVCVLLRSLACLPACLPVIYPCVCPMPVTNAAIDFLAPPPPPFHDN